MKKQLSIIKKILKKYIEITVSQAVLQSFFQKINRNKTVFLGYHGISKDKEKYQAWTLVKEGDFKRQMLFLKNRFDCCHIDDILDEKCKNGSKPKAVVTFDDGYANNLEVALPILEDLQIPAVIYVTTRHVVERELFWPDIIWMAVYKTKISSIELSEIHRVLSLYDLSTKENQYNKNVLKLLEDIKKISPRKRTWVIKEIIKKIENEVNDIELKFETEGNVFSPLDKKQLKELSKHPLITIGAHSHCHNLLDQVPVTEAEESIHKSKKILEDITQQKIHHFAYPNGNYNSDLIKVVQHAGFKSALTFSRGFFTPECDRFSIKRFGVASDMTPINLMTLLTGVFQIREWI
jgi:peptidoglycan/xylan/chitin deacetylase (PgdA/CDA1 family)